MNHTNTEEMKIIKLERPAIIKELSDKARRLRADVIRMITQARSGHPGGSLSAADIVATLYFHTMKHDPKNPKWKERDVFILSKGHAAPILYSALAESGYFDRSHLCSLRHKDSMLQGHPDMRKVPGVEMSTGSLGHGIATANGFAVGSRLDKIDNHVFVMIGDGECQEGEVWEAAMFAAHYKLDNLIAILDNNGLQIDGPVSEVMNIEPIADKWKSFGWNVIRINGHDFSQIIDAFAEAKHFEGKPTIIIADTIKGKGVSFMENVVDYHGKAPDTAQMKLALEELGEQDCT